MEGTTSAETPPANSPRGGSRTVRDGFGLDERGGNSSGRSRGQNRGRGRGNRGRDSQRSNAQRTGTTRPELGAQHRRAEDSTQPTPDSTKESPDTMTATANGQDEVEADICFICASNVVHNAIAPCNHRTCHICALRLRALYKTKACAHCRTNSDFVIFTDDATKRYEDFSDKDFTRNDEVLGIKYEKGEIFEDTVLLLRYNCPDPTCDIACYGWPDLHRHVKSAHHKVMCDLCTRNKKVFTHEHELFTNAELRKHEKYGDDNPGAVDQSGFRGHPECGFCRQRFYGDDELYTHCRDKHERCHICDRTSTGTQRQYYLDYDQLEVHFSKDHFLCPDQECLDKKFVVFESEMDLKAHQLEAHPHGLSKDARRDARRVDMSGFDIRGSQRDQPQQSNRREGRGRGRGRDPNMEPVPASTAQPMRRDELAYQRQLAIHSAQSLAPRSFGGQLTSGGAYTARPTSSTSEPATVTAPGQGSRTANNNQPPPVENLTISDETDPSAALNQSMTPSERARALRHASITERASNLLQHDQTKLQDFRGKVSSYKNSAITAPELVDNFFALFDCTSAELGKLVKELADIFEIQTKKDDLLKAWNDWRAINEDYPSLPGSDGMSITGTSSGGKRILKLKNSTAQSNRTAQKPGGWGAVAGSLNNRGMKAANAFPQLPSSSSSSKSAPKPAWLTSSNTGSQSQTATRSTQSTSASNPKTKPPSSSNTDLFPALPTAQKPSMAALRPGYAGSLVKRDTGSGGKNTPVNAWDRSNAIADFDGNLSRALEAAASNDQITNSEEGGAAAKSKNKGKKKQTLIHWG